MPTFWILLAAALLQKEPVRFSDISPDLRPILKINDGRDFDALRERIELETSRRLQTGEDEHLIYFVLQSGSFTKRLPIEPAWSARQFVEKGSGVPSDVAARMEDFLDALRRPASDQRLFYWRAHLPVERRSVAGLSEAYRGSMRFLYEKEFQAAPGDVADLYQTRGHSTDSDVEVNYTVSTALAVMAALDPGARLERVLMVGPGLDFAPRTGFTDATPPQSHQPYLTADSLLRWRLAAPDRLSINCVDINPRVVDYLEGFARHGAPTLWIREGSGDSDYQDFFRETGRQIGITRQQPGGKGVQVRRKVASAVRAGQLNIVTERYQPSPGFDIVIATNILLYFGPPELALALANIHSMMRAGGYLIHNELRPEAEIVGKALKMPPIQVRTLQVLQGRKRPLVDAFVIHRKN